jgi:hypothetical protein
VALANSRVAQENPIEALVLPIGTVDALEHAIACGMEDGLGGREDLLAWRRSMVDRIAEAEAVTERCRTLIGQRDDLRGQLDAFSAKAARVGLLEHPAVVDAFERARGALYAAPTDLDVARELVGHYQRLIAGRGDS